MSAPWVDQLLEEYPTITEPSADPLYYQRKELYKEAMNRQWRMVLELYRNEKVQGQYITRGNDTLLHVAISSATEKTVLDLLAIVQFNKEILMLKNKAGDTPLHLAAALGLDKVCRRMVKMYPKLVTDERNNLQETPLFSAVRHGKKNAFFVLEAAIHKLQKLTINEDCLSKRDITHCRGRDGNNILHYAIRGEQFDLAYEIIRLYPPLTVFVNSIGETALHTLANNPSVFKSGARFGLFDKIIYYFSSTKAGICKACSSDEENQAGAQMGDEIEPSNYQKQRRRYPQNYDMMIFFFKIIVKLLLVVLGIVLRRLHTIAKLKQKHRNAKTIMKQLVDLSTLWEYEEASGGKKPDHDGAPLSPDIESKPAEYPGLDEETLNPIEDETVLSKAIKELGLGIDMLNEVLKKGSLKIVGEEELTNISDTESPVLVAAKRGITEMVERILYKFPKAVLDQDKDKKNIILLAVEHRQVDVYKLMLEFPTTKEVFQKVDNNENSALHLAANLSHSSPWSTGTALQVQWEIKWYKDVLNSRDWVIFAPVNKEGKTPEEVFSETHYQLVKDGISWLTNTSRSCSTVATLFATVAFASASTVPGGPEQQSGFPILGKTPDFQVFAISSLVALCFSVTSLLMFLAILTSSFKVRDFEWGLPGKLIVGVTSLFGAIASSLVSFFAGDFFVVNKNLRFAVYPIYAVMGVPVILFAFAQFPLYINLIKLTIKNDPEPEVMLDYKLL